MSAKLLYQKAVSAMALPSCCTFQVVSIVCFTLTGCATHYKFLDIPHTVFYLYSHYNGRSTRFSSLRCSLTLADLLSFLYTLRGSEFLKLRIRRRSDLYRDKQEKAFFATIHFSPDWDPGEQLRS